MEGIAKMRVDIITIHPTIDGLKTPKWSQNHTKSINKKIEFLIVCLMLFDIILPPFLPALFIKIPTLWTSKKLDFAWKVLQK